MQHPVVGDNKLKSIARGFVKFSERWWVNFLIRPLIYLVPAVATAAVDHTEVKAALAEIFGTEVGEFIGTSIVLVLIGSYIYVAAIRGIYAGIESYSKPARELGVNEVLAILTALNNVVDDKCRRVGAHAKATISSQVLDPVRTFSEITRPDQQLVLLVAAIRTVFTYLDTTNALFRVGLISIRNNKPNDWVSFAPESHPPRTPANQLSAPSSTVTWALRTKSVVVVQDLQKELAKKTKQERRYLKGNLQPNENGSQLCYPITHASTGSIEYVLTITGSKKDCLIEKHVELYAWILSQFAIRIALEHSHLILKEKANGN